MLLKTAGCLFVLAVAQAWAQSDAPTGLLRGDFVNWSGTPRSGNFTFRATTHQLYSCSYDQKTYIERSNQRITFAAAGPGDHLELITDHQFNSSACYARMVQVIDPPIVPASALTHFHPRSSTSSAFPAPRANVTVAGVVLRVFPDLLALRLRTGEEQFLRLRPDTQYLAQGQASARGSLHANTLVFIRAAKDFYGEMEAYQVIWGGILEADP